MRHLSKAMSAVVLLLVVAPFTQAGEPSDPGKIDQLIDQLVSQRAALQAAVKAEAATAQELRDANAALQKRLNDLGLVGPTPGPGPGPINPPGPTPPPDPLARKLWDAYRSDSGATKADDLATLVELMRQAQTLADDPALTTIGALAGKVAAAASILAKDRLPSVRSVLKVELAAAFPDDGPLTPMVRAGAKSLFAKLQTALTEAGK